jgi:hypothetical protein
MGGGAGADGNQFFDEGDINMAFLLSSFVVSDVILSPTKKISFYSVISFFS